MKTYLLREVCALCGVSRRAVQGFEQYGLVHPCGKTNRGYLLYGEEMLPRFRQVKRLQNYGFSLAEIQHYLESETAERRALLLQKQECLQKQQAALLQYLAEIDRLLQQMQ